MPKNENENKYSTRNYDMELITNITNFVIQSKFHGKNWLLVWNKTNETVKHKLFVLINPWFFFLPMLGRVDSECIKTEKQKIQSYHLSLWSVFCCCESHRKARKKFGA